MSTLPQLIEEDIAELNNAMQELLIKSDASSALVIDKGGFIIAQCGGRVQDLDTVTLSALSAASFAATEGVASLIGEKNFTSVYQQGDHSSILVMNVDQFCLLTVIFKATLSVGAIKYYAADTIAKVSAQLKRAQHRSPDGGLDLSMLNMADPSSVFKMKVA